MDLHLGDITLLEISGRVIETASRLPGPLLRSLDAVHLATALLIRDDVDVLLTDDRSHGITVDAPA